MWCVVYDFEMTLACISCHFGSLYFTFFVILQPILLVATLHLTPHVLVSSYLPSLCPWTFLGPSTRHKPCKKCWPKHCSLSHNWSHALRAVLYSLITNKLTSFLVNLFSDSIDNSWLTLFSHLKWANVYLTRAHVPSHLCTSHNLITLTFCTLTMRQFILIQFAYKGDFYVSKFVQ